MANSNSSLYPRFSTEQVRIALKDTPVVMVVGPRQCGKTTLVRQFVNGRRVYITLDDDTALSAARSDPSAFIRGLDTAVIDEVQRAPDLLRAIKQAVDINRQPGRFLLTGSADVLTLPHVSESLAGRMEIVTLLPLSHAEILERKPTFVEKAFAGTLSKMAEVMVGNDLVRTAVAGGYPEMLRRTDPERRQAWARDYVKALVQRDVRDIAEVEKLQQMPTLLRALAHHSGQLANFSQIGAQIGLDDKTTRKYITVFEQIFLVRRVEPWFRNQLKRLVKTPKLHFLDSGLLAEMLGTRSERIAKDRSLFGQVLETFVFSEVLKQIGWLNGPHTVNHYRDKEQAEVDIVLENAEGEVVGIEVKAAATVHAQDFRGLRKLAEACGKSFRLGVLLYDERNVVPFGDRLFAAPLPCLWG